MPVSNVTEHWIKQDAITINLNHFGDPDYLQVSVLAGAVVMAFKQDIIGYNAAHNYRTWPLQAANTYLENTSAVNVYARLTRSEVNASALIIYDSVLRDIEGRVITYAEDGSEILGEADTTYFYIFLGQISSSINSNGEQIARDWEVSFRFGNLDTSQYRNEEAGGEWMKMFRLNKVTDMIDVLKTFSSAIFKRLFIGEKEIGNIQRSTDHLDIDDNVIPTTKYTEESYLSKKKDDRSKGTIASDKGIEVGQFQAGTLGSGAAIYVDEQGVTHGEVDFLKVRKKATFTTLTIQELKHIGGELVLSPAAMVCSEVEELVDGYKCYFSNEDEDGRKIYNEFEVGDQARCQTFGLDVNTYYWRLVTAVGENFIVLSKTDCDANSDIPKAGDNIVQLGNRTDADRQHAIILSAYGADAPSYKQYSGIMRYSTSGKEVTVLSPKGNMMVGDFLSTSGKNLASEIERLDIGLGKVSEQVDTEFTMWFFDYDPTLTNYPSSEWVTENMLLNHVEDLFYNTATGKAYRFVNEDGYKWKIVTDMQTVKALEDAAIANKYATEANVRLNNIVSDGMLSSVEKKEVLKEWQSVEAEYVHNVNTALSFGLTISDQNGEYYKYWSAHWNLKYYLNGNADLEDGDTPAWLQDLGTDQPIDGNTYRSKWNDYYDARAAIVNKFAELAEQKADEAKKDVDAIAADDILSKAEKKEVLREWETITSTYASHVANAGTYGVSVSELKAAYEALGTYLNAGIPWNVGGGVPLWLGTLKGSNTPIDGATYRAIWIAYYDAETAFLNDVSDTINTKANQSASGGIKNFVGTQPTPPYNRGDIWSKATYPPLYEDDELVCVTSKAQDKSFAIGDWEPASYAKTKVIKETVSELTYLLGAFEKDASGNAILKKEAGVKVTQEMATIFASKTELNTATSTINASIAGVQTTANQALVYAQKTVYNDDGTVKNIDKSGLMLEKDFASMYSQAVAADGTIMKKAEMTAYVQKNKDGTLESGVKITADNVNINGFVNVGGNKMTIGGFSIESDKLTVSTPLEGDAFVSGSYTTMLDGSGIDVNIGNGLITSRIGLDYFTDVDTQYFTMVNVDNNQPTGGRRIDRVCALRANLLDDDYGLLINGGATHILSSGITRLNGLTLNTRVVTSNYAPEENDDILVVNAEGAVTITLSSTIPVGKVYFIKAKTGFGLTLSGYLRASSGSSYENTTISIGGKSCIVVHTDAAWTVYNCE